MSTSLRFREHEVFQRAALQMVCAGALAGLATHIVLGPAGATSPWALALVAAATALGALGPRLQVSDLVVRLGFMAMAAAALSLSARAGSPQAGLASFALLFGAAMSWGLRGRRLLVAVAASALVAVTARHTGAAVGHAAELSFLPTWMLATGAGATFGLVSVFALVPRHVELERDQVTAAYNALGGSLTGEVRELVDRGHALWLQTSGQLDARDVNRRTLQEGVQRLLEVARRWQALDSAGTEAMAVSLTERMASLEQRIEATDDEITREQYQQARAALAEQLRYIKDIGLSRDRVLARMHNYLAAMERLRMSVINAESAHMSRDSEEVQPLLASLEEIWADMDACSEALVEAGRAGKR